MLCCCCAQFHLENAKKRAQQRLREGRAKPIDVLAANLHLMEEFDVNVTTPYSVFAGISLSECRELADDIKGYQARALRQFWLLGAASGLSGHGSSW